MTQAIYLRDVEVAKMFSVSRTTVWKWSGIGKLPEPVKISEGCTRWNRLEIEAMYPARLAG